MGTGGSNVALLLMAMLWNWPGQTGVPPASQPGRSGQAAPSARQPEPRGLRLKLNAPDRPVAPPALALGGSTLAVDVRGKPGSACQWQVAFRQTVVSHGDVVLDKNGEGQFLLNVADVRVRTRLKLVLTQGRLEAVRDLDILPSTQLPELAEQIRSLELGIIDDRGAIQAALRAEKAEFENLSTRLLADAFEGGAVMLAGFADSNVLAEACLRVEKRIKNGMTVIVFNPPDGWRQWGIGSTRAASALAGPVVLAGGRKVGGVIEPSDLGAGPWEMELDLGEPWHRLAWVRGSVRDRNGKAAVERELVLAAARRLGSGRIAVVQLGPLSDPLHCPVEREILAEMVLWTLGKQVTTTQPGGSQ